jgi:hypothetical protein
LICEIIKAARICRGNNDACNSYFGKIGGQGEDIIGYFWVDRGYFKVHLVGLCKLIVNEAGKVDDKGRRDIIDCVEIIRW